MFDVDAFISDCHLSLEGPAPAAAVHAVVIAPKCRCATFAASAGDHSQRSDGHERADADGHQRAESDGRRHGSHTHPSAVIAQLADWTEATIRLEERS